jgi:beta-glucosidase
VNVDLVAGRTYSFVVELRHTPTGAGLSGLTIGAMGPQQENMMEEAVTLAAQCDVSVVVVGTNDDWESEGWDRDTIALPGEQDQLIAEVAKVSKRTIVIVNAGSPVSMPWLDEVEAVIYAWFPGQEFGDALVDLLVGDVEPSGRLPVTLPRRLEDTPAFEHHPGRNGVAKYLEGRLIGYRWYDTIGREPLFPFGFGLGYADVQIIDASKSGTHGVDVAVRNESDRAGVQVVQVYAHRKDRDGLPSDEPDQKLVGYARAKVAAKGTTMLHVDLDPDAYRMWDPETSAWTQWTGKVELRVGTSSRHIAHRIAITL